MPYCPMEWREGRREEKDKTTCKLDRAQQRWSQTETDQLRHEVEILGLPWEEIGAIHKRGEAGCRSQARTLRFIMNKNANRQRRLSKRKK